MSGPKLNTVRGRPRPDTIPFNFDADPFLVKNVDEALNALFAGGPVVLAADQFDNPVNADFVVNALAPAQADPLNAALVVRAFDDAVEEGIATGFSIPAGTTGLRLQMISRAAAAPGAAVVVVPALYARSVPNNGAVSAWSAQQVLGNVDIPTNTNFQYDTFDIALADLGVQAGDFVQFELTRDATNVADTLVGDWLLLELQMAFRRG